MKLRRTPKPASPRKGKTYPARILTPNEATRLIAACDATPSGIRNAALFAVMYRSGLRVSEALALAPEDCDSEAGTLHVTRGKGGKSRIAAMDAGGFALLDRWQHVRVAPPGAPVFCTRRGSPLYKSYVNAAIKRSAAKAGITKRVHAHGLRHAHAHELAAEGVSVTTIRDQLGHSSLQTTDVYLRHIAPKQRIDRIRTREWGITTEAVA